MNRTLRNHLLTACFYLMSGAALLGQVNARMLRYPDVSKTHIVFTYAGDLWLVPKDGGTATKISSPKGEELFAKFSPDGQNLAYNANYDGALNIYIVPTTGGMAKPITNHGMTDRLVDWYPDGQSLLFASSRESGKQRFNQFYKVSKNGGLPEKLPLAYGEFAAISPDGKQLAFTMKSTAFRTWKRYLGGLAPDIYTFDLGTFASQNITSNDASDELPMWHGHTIYYLSDRGADKRMNIWSYDLNTKQTKQITHFKNEDVHFPSLGPDEIVFAAAGKLHLLNLKTEKHHPVDVKVVTDGISLLPRPVKAKDFMTYVSVSPDGKRAIVEARGDMFSLPAERGFVKNLTRTSGIAERYPAWSPDGKTLAYWTDRSGEYELAVKGLEKGDETILTQYGPGYRYRLFWSPDSKKLAYMDKAMKIFIFDRVSKKTTQVDQALFYYQGTLQNFSVSWSADSRWLAYSRDLPHQNQALFLFDTRDGKRTQLTSGFYSDANPVFDPEGNYLYFTSNRNFSPLYSDFDNSFVYNNSTHLAALTLRKEVPSPLAARNDAVDLKKEDMKKEEKKEEDQKKNGEAEKKKEEIKAVEIDLDGIENRIVILPPKPGNIGNIAAIKGKVIFHRIPNSGSLDENKPVIAYDLMEREEKTIISSVDFFQVAENGEKMLVLKDRNLAIVKIEPDQKMEKLLPVDDMEMIVDPKAEWKQIFTDAWRFERDFFYDPTMHGVNWNEVRNQYSTLLDDAVTRWDVNYVLGEMIGEINASHTYRGGGDGEQPVQRSTGYLGVDFGIRNGKYSIARIIRPAAWETEVRSPLDRPGIDVREGDYLLEVNGTPLSVNTDPWAYFGGLAGKTVELKVNRYEIADSAKTVVVELLGDETRLRNLAWIEDNRKNVETATGGRVGYVFVPSTGLDGQFDLVRQFYGQSNKEGLIIDERFNNGGQIPDRFVELLNRKPLAFWAVRDGKNWQWPPVANFGPKVMLINGWSGSGGDAFPDYFRKLGLGPLIGSRTWGGLIGITGAPGLIDGGGVTVPTFRMYDPDGKWFKEGHGVDPDIVVPEDPTALAKGIDTQLERGIQEVLKLLNEAPKPPKQPAYENRN